MNGIKNKNVEDSFPIWAGVIALVVLVYLLNVFRQTSVIQQAKYIEEPTIDDELHNWTVNNPQ